MVPEKSADEKREKMKSQRGNWFNLFPNVETENEARKGGLGAHSTVSQGRQGGMEGGCDRKIAFLNWTKARRRSG